MSQFVGHKLIPQWWRRQMETFSALLTLHQWIPLTKVSDAELWCLLWSPPEQTVEQANKTPVIWDAITLMCYCNDTKVHTIGGYLVWIHMRVNASQITNNGALYSRAYTWEQQRRHLPHYLTLCKENPFIKGRESGQRWLRVTGLCAGNSPETGEFPAQRAGNAENVSIWWRHHADLCYTPIVVALSLSMGLFKSLFYEKRWSVHVNNSGKMWQTLF